MEGSGRLSETIQIEIKEGRHLKGSKNDNLTTCVKLEFDGRIIGESAKVALNNSSSVVDYNHTSYLDVTLVEDPNAKVTIDDVVSKPLILTFLEVLPKEKKQKEERVNVLGQCSVDFLPFVRDGEMQINATYTIHPISNNPETKSQTASAMDKSVLSASESDENKPEIEVCLSLNQPLFDDEMLKQINTLTIRVDSAYSLPDAFSNGANGAYNYLVGLPIPQTGGKEGYVIFQNGTYKGAGDKESKKKLLKWHNATATATGAQMIANNLYERAPLEEQKGDIMKDDHGEHGRLVWDIEKRCYFDAECKNQFRSIITTQRLWPVEIMRVASAPKSGSNSKKSHDDDIHNSPLTFHGVCYVDLGPLLYPGVKSVSGSFQVHPYNEVELEKMTSRKTTQASDEVSRVLGLSRGNNSTGGGGKGKSSVKRQSVMKNNEVSSADVEAEHHRTSNNNNISPDAAVYAETKTYIYIEFTLATPLIPRRHEQQLEILVSQIIPPRPAAKIQVGGAERAVKDYHAQLTSVARMLLDEFRSLYGEEVLKGKLEQDSTLQIERKKKLYYELNASGKYFAYKEQLKHAIVKIVREKFMKTSVFANAEELKHFLSELYVYLMDEMHFCVGGFLSLNGENPNVKAPDISSSQLKQFADEACDFGDLKSAAAYYKERIVKSERDSRCWFDFGVFHLRSGNTAKAKECFRESIALEQNFYEGLLMCGVVYTMEGNFHHAEVMLERAVNLMMNTGGSAEQAPHLAWLIIAVFYQLVDNQFRREHALAEARKINSAIVEAQRINNINNNKTESSESTNSNQSLNASKSGKNPTAKVSTSNSSGCAHQTESTLDVEGDVSGDDEGRIFLQTASWLLEHHALSYAEAVLALELVESGGKPCVEYFVLLARLQMEQGCFDRANETINKAIALDVECVEGWAISGHLAHKIADQSTMKDCYERTIAFVDDADNMHTILMRLGEVYMKEGKHAKAKRIYLMASKYKFTCRTWLGVGMACYRLNELDQAEDALSEANVLNNTNPLVWAYLSLVTLKTGRQLEAEQCYKFASKLSLNDAVVEKEIKSLQHQVGFGDPSIHVC